MQRKEVNLETGEEQMIDLTQKEIDEIMASQTDPAIEAMKQRLTTAATQLFESMPLGKQALWAGVKQAVSEAINNSDFTRAKTILETLPNLYEGAEQDRAAFLSLFPKI